MSGHNLPTKTGLYWASFQAVSDEWELIVKIQGKLPFLRCSFWRYFRTSMSEFVPDLIDPSVLFFGSKIDIPKRDPNEGYL